MRSVSRGRRFCCQPPASSSWWTSVRSAASSCRPSFTPPTAWASEPSPTCTRARSFSARPTPSPVRAPAPAPRVESARVVVFKCPVSRFFLFLEQHFTEVVQGEEFLGLTLQQVCSLISSDKLTVSTEEKVSGGDRRRRDAPACHCAVGSAAGAVDSFGATCSLCAFIPAAVEPSGGAACQ